MNNETRTWFAVEKRVSDGVWQRWFAPYLSFEDAFKSYQGLEAERPNIWRIARITGAKGEIVELTFE